MSKKFLSKIIASIIILSAPLLWLFAEIFPSDFEWFNLSIAIALISGGFGILMLLTGIFEKNITTLKKIKILAGCGLLICMVFALVSAIIIPENLLSPIIVSILAATLLLSTLATGGKSWDQGDNKKVGYKNYHQRQKDKDKE